MKLFFSFLYVMICLIALNCEYELSGKGSFVAYYLFWIINAMIATYTCSKLLSNKRKQSEK